MENDPWENIKAQLTAASTQDNMLGRPDYYEDVFAIQNALDASLIEKEAQRILDDPVLLNKMLKEGGMENVEVPRGNKLSIGIGAHTDKINRDALIATVRGLLTGGIPSAMWGGAKSYITDMIDTFSTVNRTNDPIATLNALQGWTATREPAPVVSNMLNYNRPYNSVGDNRLHPAPIGRGYDTSAYGGAGGYVNSEGNAPGASPGEVGDAAFSGDVGYDQ